MTIRYSTPVTKTFRWKSWLTAAQRETLGPILDAVPVRWDQNLTVTSRGSVTLWLSLLDFSMSIRVTGTGKIADMRWERYVPDDSASGGRHEIQNVAKNADAMWWRDGHLTFGEPTPPIQADWPSYAIRWIAAREEALGDREVLEHHIKQAETELDRRTHLRENAERSLEEARAAETDASDKVERLRQLRREVPR